MTANTLNPGGHAASPDSPYALPGHLVDGVNAVLDRLYAWKRRARRRRALACLDDRTLRDIGLTRAHVLYELDKPFWRA